MKIILSIVKYFNQESFKSKVCTLKAFQMLEHLVKKNKQVTDYTFWLRY